jgi:hypothetical protein
MSGDKKILRERMRSLLLSIVCPGLGEFYNGDIARAVIIVLIRVFAILFPVIYLFSRVDAALPFLVCIVAVALLTHVYSPFAAFISAGKKIGRTLWQRILYSVVFFLFHWGLIALSAFVFITFFPILRLSGNEGYPLFPGKHFVLCSVRSLPAYHEGDTVLVSQDGVYAATRIICKEEGAYIDYHDGLISILGEDLPQTVRTADELAALGFPNDEQLFAERLHGNTYCIARQTGVVSKTVRFAISRNEIFLCPDNRVAGSPRIMKTDSIVARIEWLIPFTELFYD